jgi:plasmid stabilization system protein ParE
MKVVVNEAAARDLDDVFNWISKDNPRAAAAMVRRISARINQLGLPVCRKSADRDLTRECVNWSSRCISSCIRSMSMQMR